MKRNKKLPTLAQVKRTVDKFSASHGNSRKQIINMPTLRYYKVTYHYILRHYNVTE